MTLNCGRGLTRIEPHLRVGPMTGHRWRTASMEEPVAEQSKPKVSKLASSASAPTISMRELSRPDSPVESVAQVSEPGKVKTARRRHHSVPKYEKAVKAVKAVKADGLKRELDAVQKAEAAYNAGDTGRALAILEGFKRGSAKGQLNEERKAIRVLIRCRGAQANALQRARRFIATHPRSVYVERIRSECRLGTSTDTHTSETLRRRPRGARSSR